jgi:hypothetical protein
LIELEFKTRGIKTAGFSFTPEIEFGNKGTRLTEEESEKEVLRGRRGVWVEIAFV